MKSFSRFLAAALAVAAFGAVADDAAPRRPVDLVIALDVSGSMSGLIDSARQRLWDVVNTFDRAQPTPDLRVAVVSFGAPAYGPDSGFVRIDQPLTRDLDRVNETLFGFSTNGGDEYVARAIVTAIDGLEWSRDDDAMRVVFVAGNESAEQDPAVALNAALQRAQVGGIIVNALYCGSENHNDAVGWRQVALHGQGTFASIDQNANAVAAVETPMDARLAELNDAYNDTVIPYGTEGEAAAERQQRQDDNARGMSVGALASRLVTKAGALYESAKWDLVEAFERGQDLDSIDREALPAPMQAMAPEELHDAVTAEAKRRAAIKREIAELDSERRSYVIEHRQKAGAAGLDAAVVGALVEQAEAHGFEFEE